MSKVKTAAQKGYSRSGVTYEKGRPDYPSTVIEQFLFHLKINSESRVLELAAGTGKFTRHLTQVCSNVVATEPVLEMRNQFAKVLPQIQVTDGTAENIQFENESFDIVIAANAFHWFDSVKARDEIYRVLRSRGTLGLIWYSLDISKRYGWFDEILSVVDRYSGETLQHNHMKWKEPFEHTNLFNELKYEYSDHPLQLEKEDVISRMASISFISALEENEFQRVVDELENILDGELKATGRKLVIPYRAHIYWCQRQ